MKRAVLAATFVALTTNLAMAQTKEPDSKPKPAAPSSAEVRDWAQIDTNKDNLISPEEMEKYLRDAWAAQKK